MSARKSTYAIFGIFFIEACVLGMWIPRIPDIKEKLQLSDGELGVSFLAMPIGILLGLFVAAAIIEKLGSLRRACQVFLPVWAMLFILPVLAYSQLLFICALLVCGLSVGLIEVAMNTEADRIENFYRKNIMSRCHGFWSLGSLVGALVSGLVAQMGLPIEPHFLLVMPLLAVAGFYCASQLPVLNSVTDSQMAQESKQPLIRLPEKAIVLLCVLPIGIMLVEGAFIDWSAVFMRTILEASPIVISVTYAFFSIVMAAVRMFGDTIREHVSAQRIVQVSALAASAGITVFALAPNTAVAFAGAALSGMGVAIVYPLAITAAAQRPGKSSADNVAAITMISFSAFLVAPPVIGLLSELWGLRVALLVLAPMALTTFFLSAEIKPVGTHEHEAGEPS